MCIRDSFDIDNLHPSNNENIEYESIIKKCYDAMLDDFNSPKLISHLFEISRIIENVKKKKDFISTKSINELKNYMQVFLVDILGFSIDSNENEKIEESNKLISTILEIRDFSRKNKNYEMSDLIREKLNSLGIKIEDS